MARSQNLLVALGGGDEIGASSYLLMVDGKHILIDAGLRLRGKRHFPDFSFISQVGMVGLYECDCVCLTHAHLDHSGSLPAVFQKTHGEVPIFATAPTRDIAKILLNDTIKIKRKHREFKGDIQLQEYEKAITEQSIDAIQPIDYFKTINPAPGIQITYFPAGHILGAAMILIEVEEHRILISGDFSGDGQQTISGYSLPEKFPSIDLLVCESTYAYKGFSHVDLEEQQEELINQIQIGIDRGGKVLIPAFAVGRAQEVLLLLRRAFEHGQVSRFPVWSDGMVNQVCNVYNTHRAYLQGDHLNGQDIFFDRDLGIGKSQYDLRKPSFKSLFKASPPSCIVASSGMLMSGSRSSFYAAEMMENERDVVLFTGYLDEESPGSRLVKINERGQKYFRLNRKDYRIRAKIMPYHLSAHASLNSITDFVEQINPQNVFFVHGYPDLKAEMNLFDHFYQWGNRGIHPMMARNNTPIYF